MERPFTFPKNSVSLSEVYGILGHFNDLREKIQFNDIQTSTPSSQKRRTKGERTFNEHSTKRANEKSEEGLPYARTISLEFCRYS